MIALGTNGDTPIGSFGIMPKGAKANPTGARSGKAASIKWREPLGSHRHVQGEHLAYRQNYMDLDPTYTDKFGDPTAALHAELDRTRVQDARVRIKIKIPSQTLPARWAPNSMRGPPSRAPYQCDQTTNRRTSRAAVVMGGLARKTRRGQQVPSTLGHGPTCSWWVASAFPPETPRRNPTSDLAVADLHGGGRHDQTDTLSNPEKIDMRRRGVSWTIPAAAMGGTLPLHFGGPNRSAYKAPGTAR